MKLAPPLLYELPMLILPENVQ